MERPPEETMLPPLLNYPVPCRSGAIASLTAFDLAAQLEDIATNMHQMTQGKDEKERMRGSEWIESYVVQQLSPAQQDPSLNVELQLHLFQLDRERLASILLSPDALQAGVQEDIVLLLSAIFSFKDPFISFEERVRYLFNRPRQIGEKSTYGIVAQTGLGDVDFIAVKVAKAKGNMAHEALVGIAALNSLRQDIPNFVYVYGLFECGQLVDGQGDVKDWCRVSDTRQTYLCMEQVQDAQTLYNILPTLPTAELAEILLQVFGALHLAYERFHFTHWDLRTWNILVKTYPQPLPIPIFTARGMLETILTSRVATIIDFGSSYVELGTLKFQGFQWSASSGPSPLLDIHMLLDNVKERLVKVQGKYIARLQTDGSNLLVDQLLLFFQGGLDRYRGKDPTAFLTYAEPTLLDYVQLYIQPASPDVSTASTPSCTLLHTVLRNMEAPTDVVQYHLMLLAVNEHLSSEEEKTQTRIWLMQEVDMERIIRDKSQHYLSLLSGGGSPASSPIDVACLKTWTLAARHVLCSRAGYLDAAQLETTHADASNNTTQLLNQLRRM